MKQISIVHYQSNNHQNIVPSKEYAVGTAVILDFNMLIQQTQDKVFHFETHRKFPC